jgi:hypothetical protein
MWCSLTLVGVSPRQQPPLSRPTLPHPLSLPWPRSVVAAVVTTVVPRSGQPTLPHPERPRQDPQSADGDAAGRALFGCNCCRTASFPGPWVGAGFKAANPNTLNCAPELGRWQHWACGGIQTLPHTPGAWYGLFKRATGAHRERGVAVGPILGLTTVAPFPPPPPSSGAGVRQSCRGQGERPERSPGGYWVTRAVVPHGLGWRPLLPPPCSWDPALYTGVACS